MLETLQYRENYDLASLSNQFSVDGMLHICHLFSIHQFFFSFFLKDERNKNSKYCC